ncbi:SDR family NAD(P)-dependent oxidoreductase [Kitasatospora sp. NBC_01287]|uniref:SDR family NAD(P)-dependent oxidoreductase n=1 Tax=Kitasatospora sp. NBC_01287 TaxID=2903573 RepID=UPI002258E6C5|nr:SDR family NAD(P)-dependent oxidoreductase [Kitasatospora sp. NBC_01287]MCX4748898.1 SDR family NAD(P)-dependent oxidoreductase [Kitasatospora sp. NBC_01287]
MTEQRRRTALVTGGTSGIGLATAELLAEQGHAVFLCGRDAGVVETVVDKLRGRGLEVAGTRADVRSAADVRTLVERAVAAHGPVDVLVNNAGRGGGGRTEEIPDELWDDVIETNLTSVFRVTREVLTTGRMREGAASRAAAGAAGASRGAGGRIISIASTGGKQGVLLAAPYSASKHGVIGFTKALGLELATSGITVNAVCPGYVETPMAERVRLGYADHWGVTEEEVLARFEAKIPLGRYTTAQEVAAMVGYLAGGHAAAITAQALNVCGGLGSY